MFLTNVLFKKTKSKMIMVLMESAVSGHKFNTIRERLADKLELIRFDPYMIIGFFRRLKPPRCSSSTKDLANTFFKRRAFIGKGKRSGA